MTVTFQAKSIFSCLFARCQDFFPLNFMTSSWAQYNHIPSGPVVSECDDLVCTGMATIPLSQGLPPLTNTW